MERRLAAILLTDMVGYSRLIGVDEEGTIARQRVHREQIIDLKISKHGGRIVKTTGDGLLVEFPSVVDAVKCAIEVQTELADRDTDVPKSRRIQYRIGINLGDIVLDGDDILGDGVNVAARLEGLAKPGGVCISGTVHDHLSGKVSAVFEEAGEQTVKNVPRPVRVWHWQPGRSAGDPPKPDKLLSLPDKPSIAVLPFANMSGEPEQEYLADGMVEEIVTALSQMRWLFVIARTSTFAYKGRDVNIKEVGRELGVRYILEGSVRKSGQRLRIVAQLIDAVAGTYIWADRFEGSVEDVFDLQDGVTQAVVGAIEPKLEQAEIDRAKRKPTKNLDAYDYYLRGISNYYPATRDEAGAMLRHFKCAINRDPNFAAAYGVAAWCNARRKGSGWILDKEQEKIETARLARSAIHLAKDDALTIAWAAFGLALVVGELDEATRLIDRALELNPNLAIAWGSSGWMRVWAGDLDIAQEHLARARRLSPFGPIMGEALSATAHAYFFSGQYAEACAWAERTSLESPHVLGGIRVLAASNALAGRYERARTAVAQMLQIDPVRRVSNMWDVWGPYRHPEYVAQYLHALRLAGLPEK